MHAFPAALRAASAVLDLVIAGPSPGHAGALPTRPATCTATRVAAIEHRLQSGPGGPPITDSGSAIRYTNGGYQVSYDEIPSLAPWRKGDPVTLCLIQIPQHCPPGDVRGRIYTATNLRLLDSWTAPDAEHSCGGA